MNFNKIDCLNRIMINYSAASISYGDFLVLLQCCQDKDTVLELGTNTGSTTELLGHMGIKNIISIDVFEDRNLIENEEQRKFYVGQQNSSHSYEAVKNRLSKYNNIKLERGLTKDYVKNLTDNSIDTVFIDADHSKEGVKRDFELYFSKVKNGGIILLHDIVENIQDHNNNLREMYQFYQETVLNDYLRIRGCISIFDPTDTKTVEQEGLMFYTSMRIVTKLKDI